MAIRSGVTMIEGIFQRVRRRRAGGGFAVVTRIVFERFLNQITQSQPGSAHLRFRISLRTFKDLRDLAVLESLNVVENKHRSVSGRQILDKRLKSDAINDAVESRVWTAKFIRRCGDLVVA